MIKKHEIKSTISIILPLMAAFLAQKGMQFVDTMMMGWIGPAALAAGAIATAIFITILVFGMGILSAVGVFIARAKGENNNQDIIASLKNGIWLAIGLSLPFILIIWHAPTILMRNENPEVILNATLLLHGLALGLPGYLLFLVFREFIAAFSVTRIIMIVTVGSIPLTYMLNKILIYGDWGFPALGVSGIGYAGAFVMWFMFFCLLLYSLCHPTLKKYLYFENFKIEKSKIKDMSFIGLPSGLFFLLESCMFLSAVIMMGYFGVDALAAFQIAMQCANIAYAIPISIAMATALQTSHAIGAREYFRLKSLALQNFGLGLVFSILVAAIFIIFPDSLINIFLADNSQQHETVALAIHFLVIAAFFQCFDTIQSIANGMLRGLKDTFIPMLLSVGCFWLIGIGSTYYFSFHTTSGPNGIWYGISLGIWSLGIVLIIRLIKKLKCYSNVL